MSLIDKIKSARRSTIKVDSFEFTVSRPTDMDMVKMSGESRDEFLKKFVVDWKGVKEIDLIPGGDPFEVPFDSELFYEWLSDNPKYWEPIINGIINSYKDHEAKRIDNEKK